MSDVRVSATLNFHPTVGSAGAIFFFLSELVTLARHEFNLRRCICVKFHLIKLAFYNVKLSNENGHKSENEVTTVQNEA
jgi:hypothetical protein